MGNTLSNQNSYMVKNNIAYAREPGNEAKNNTAPHTPQMKMYNNIATMHKLIQNNTSNTPAYIGVKF